ncbi:hypothetical protein PVK06_010240 [Gossypium arboreum]|uniref:Uncharacterized protein n=1 Tax=Gossypium arboreum TaxID=29729 RepID=A0ABR0QPS2_GOSAR|nr:hypothetical protein PVK06_010240 [Gossypium arboreum]
MPDYTLLQSSMVDNKSTQQLALPIEIFNKSSNGSEILIFDFILSWIHGVKAFSSHLLKRSQYLHSVRFDEFSKAPKENKRKIPKIKIQYKHFMPKTNLLRDPLV